MSETKDYKFYMDNGVVNYRDGQYQKAIENIDKSLEMKNDWAIHYFYKGACCDALEKTDEAIENYSKAIDYDSDMTDAYYNRAKLILSQKTTTKEKINGALKDLEKALELDPKFQDAIFAIAAAYKKLKQYHKSLEYLEKLLEINPEHLYGKALQTLILEKYMVKEDKKD